MSKTAAKQKRMNFYFYFHAFVFFQNITFNSVTNCLGSRKLVHCGVLYKVSYQNSLNVCLLSVCALIDCYVLLIDWFADCTLIGLFICP